MVDKVFFTSNQFKNTQLHGKVQSLSKNHANFSSETEKFFSKIYILSK